MLKSLDELDPTEGEQRSIMTGNLAASKKSGNLVNCLE
jgi:hypothetical protein